MRALRVSSISTNEPVSLGEVKTHLRLSTSTSEDGLLSGYITAAREVAENKTKRSLVNTQWRMTLDGFTDEIKLPRPPLSSLTTEIAIRYVNDAGSVSTVASSVYVVDSDSEPGKIYLAEDQDWPTDLDDRKGVITITYRSGYCSTAITCPETIKNWMKVRVGQMYELREPLIEARSLLEVPRDYVDGLLDSYCVVEAE